MSPGKINEDFFLRGEKIRDKSLTRNLINTREVTLGNKITIRILIEKNNWKPFLFFFDKTSIQLSMINQMNIYIFKFKQYFKEKFKRRVKCLKRTDQIWVIIKINIFWRFLNQLEHFFFHHYNLSIPIQLTCFFFL